MCVITLKQVTVKMVYSEGVLFLAGFEARYSEVSAVNHSTVIFIDNVIRESVTK